MAFHPPYTVRSYLHITDWRRGSFIESYNNSELISSLSFNHQRLVNSGYVLLITLYDCALINNCFKTEPDVSYILAKPIDKLDNAFANSKHERRIHFTASCGSRVQHFESKAGLIGFFSREKLLGASISKDFKTSDKEQQIVGKWISKRLTQPTYPDSFNNRIDRKKKDKLFKTYSTDICAFYIRIDPVDQELANDEIYRVSIIAAVEGNKLRNLKKNQTDLAILNSINLVLPKSKKINIESFQMMAEDQITLDMLRYYVQWADEYFSFRNNSYDALPVNLTG